jgi:hypothetical protein
MGGGNNPDEASVLDKNRTRVRKDERASSTGVWFGGGWAKSWGEEVQDNSAKLDARGPSVRSLPLPGCTPGCTHLT